MVNETKDDQNIIIFFYKNKIEEFYFNGSKPLNIDLFQK